MPGTSSKISSKPLVFDELALVSSSMRTWVVPHACKEKFGTILSSAPQIFSRLARAERE
jgi:hypothetical protein